MLLTSGGIWHSWNREIQIWHYHDLENNVLLSSCLRPCGLMDNALVSEPEDSVLGPHLNLILF